MASPREEAAVAREELIKQKKNEKKSQTTLAVKLNIVLEARESPLAGQAELPLACRSWFELCATPGFLYTTKP